MKILIINPNSDQEIIFLVENLKLYAKQRQELLNSSKPMRMKSRLLQE
jgi:hypothetical protein